MTISLGTYMKNEAPGRLTYAFLDASGAAIDITDFTVTATVQGPDGVVEEVAGQVDAGASGTCSVPWTAASMTDQVGPWSLVFWAVDGSTSYASVVIYYNVADVSAPTP